LKRLLTALCGTIAAGGLFAIMLLTLVDVSGRKLLSSSVPGSLELTEILMVVVIFAALPLVCLRGEHVVFDSLDSLLPPWLQRVQRLLVELLSAGLLGGLAWLMWLKAGQLASYGETTAQLKLPLYVMVYVMAVLLALAALMHAWLIVKPDAGLHEIDLTEGAL
jgi:TRAP-type transport system small permease protein